MEQKILDIIKKHPINFKDLRAELNLKGFQQSKQLDEALTSLRHDNKIYHSRKTDKYHLKDEETEIGIYHSTRKDFGFVDNDTLSVFIPGKFTLNALEGDTVKIKLFPKYPDQTDDRRAGKVLRVMKRNGNNIVGRIRIVEGEKQFIPDDLETKYTYTLENYDDLNEGDVISTTFKDINDLVIQLSLNHVIGNEADATIDWLIVTYKNNMSLDFSPEILQEIKNEENKAPGNRTDLSSRIIVTIDGISSKDLDDAIDVQKLANGNYKLGVHIADVSHYVERDSKLDYEAEDRGTSVYLINHVLPMLPEELSNDLCSLNPSTKKLTMTCEMEINPQGKVVNSKIFNSQIESKYRLTYNEVDKLYTKEIEFLRDDEKLSEMLFAAKDLAEIMRKVKIEKGMIDFVLPEIQIRLDKKGEPIALTPKFQTPAEKMIEDLMVITNETVARAFSKNNLPGLFRVHGKPVEEKLTDFLYLLRSFGETIDKPYDAITSKDIAQLIRRIDDKEYGNIIKRYTIQSMEKAKYHQFNEGHYALGLDDYLHFTSPIRRYPDLVVHRLLKKWIIDEGKLPDNQEVEIELSYLTPLALETSLKEKEGMVAERKLADIKKARFMQKLVGEKFVGIIVSITSFGFFVELENFTQGLVRLDSLTDDEYQYDAEQRAIIGKENNRSFKIGQNIQVKIAAVDTIRGAVDMEVV